MIFKNSYCVGKYFKKGVLKIEWRVIFKFNYPMDLKWIRIKQFLGFLWGLQSFAKWWIIKVLQLRNSCIKNSSFFIFLNCNLPPNNNQFFTLINFTKGFFFGTQDAKWNLWHFTEIFYWNLIYWQMLWEKFIDYKVDPKNNNPATQICFLKFK